MRIIKIDHHKNKRKFFFFLFNFDSVQSYPPTWVGGCPYYEFFYFYIFPFPPPTHLTLQYASKAGRKKVLINNIYNTGTVYQGHG